MKYLKQTFFLPFSVWMEHHLMLYQLQKWQESFSVFFWIYANLYNLRKDQSLKCIHTLTSETMLTIAFTETIKLCNLKQIC